MSEIKYTKSGKKVAVLGKLNDAQWIVQEIMVANGQEFPAGANFVESGLLDVPAKTWQERHVEDVKAQTAQVEAEAERAIKECRVVKMKAKVHKLINACLQSYPDADVSQLDTLFAVLCGEITHLVFASYQCPKIVPLADALTAMDNDYGPKLDGLRLLSLFGVNEVGGRYDKTPGNKLAWQINNYRDGSGGWTPVYPCRSHADAVRELDRIIGEARQVSEEHIKAKAKYGLTYPTQERIAEFRAAQLACAEQSAVAADNALKQALQKVELLRKAKEAR